MGGRPRQLRPRRPAEYTGDGVDSPRFHRSGPGVEGRPHVLVHRGDRTRLEVGRRAVIGAEVEVMVGGNHRIDWVSAFAIREIYGLPGAYGEGNPWSKGDITVGSDVVIGRGARILSGVTVGDGAVVLPYSVVTRDVSPGQIVAGHPAAAIGTRPCAAGPPPPVTPSVAGVRRRAARTLRAVADRIGGEPLPGFPALREPPQLPQPITMGAASYFEPVVRAEGDPEVRVEVAPFASVSYDTEFLFPAGPADPARVAQRSVDGPPGDRRGPRRAVVGGDTWITRGTRVVGEVTIGAGAVVGAYSVVYEDVRPYAIVAGNPAVEVGRRFDDETVEALLRISWWDWPEELVKQRAPELCSTDVDGFIRRYDPAPAGGGAEPE